MKTKGNKEFKRILLFAFSILLLLSGISFAHCDTLNGPVVKTARVALESGDVTPVLKWVPEEEEATIRAAFERTIAVRKLSDEARELADMYFFETLVRIHRAGEGEPYSGLKPGTDVDPAVVLADKAIQSGSADEIAKVLTNAVDQGLKERLHRVLIALEHSDQSVAAGREFVEAYVQFTHYAEGIHNLVKSGPAHDDHH